jgi:long-chain fatty acid transport protein
VTRFALRVRVLCVVWLCTLAFSVVASPAHAQGFGLFEQGACQMGRAGAGVASPCNDGSSMFFNPAGLALDPKATVVSGGFTAIAPRGQFTDSTTHQVSALNDNTYFAPSAYFATPMGKRAVVGIGVFAPYGLTTDWPTTSEGRYIGYKSSIKSLYVQPTVSARVHERVVVGAGLDITHTSLELRRRVDLSTLAITGGGGLTFGNIGVPKGTDFADVDLNGSGTHVGAHLGVIIKAHDRLSIGARYLARQQVAITNGNLTIAQIPTNLGLAVPLGPTLPAGTPIDKIVAPAFATGGTLSSQTSSTSLPLPDQFVFGLAIKATDKLLVLADYQYTHWSMLDEITILNQFAPPTLLVEQFGDTHGLRVGAEYSLANAKVRAGYDDHGPAAPPQSVTPLLPDADRHEFAFGVSIPRGKHVDLDLAYMYINQADRSGRTSDGGLTPTAATNNGVYEYHANLLGVSVVLRF